VAYCILPLSWDSDRWGDSLCWSGVFVSLITGKRGDSQLVSTGLFFYCNKCRTFARLLRSAQERDTVCTLVVAAHSVVVY
jgi:hypothetical protein